MVKRKKGNSVESPGLSAGYLPPDWKVDTLEPGVIVITHVGYEYISFDRETKTVAFVKEEL